MNINNIKIDESEGYKRYRRLCRQFNRKNQNDDRTDSMTGIRRIRFINKNIDKTAPNWARTNMIEVYNINIYHKDGFTVGLTDYEANNAVIDIYPDDNGLKRKDFRQFNSPFVSPLNIIQEVYCPFLICKKGETLYDIADLYTTFGELRDMFEYDNENDAYIVDNIRDIVTTDCAQSHSCYKKLMPHTKQLLENFGWSVNWSYVPIKTDESLLAQSGSAWL